jgi:CRISPR/Cas system-associated exonuclease Cas4 (RecB family)
LTEDGTLVYKKKEVVAVQQKALQVAAKQRLGLFQFDRENNQLMKALCNPEHTGCICGVGPQMSWKHSFLKDSTSYKKRDRYKKTLEEKIEEKVNTLFENMFMTFIQNLSQQQGSPPLHLLAPQATNLSSMGSTIGLGTWYPMDDIMVDMPCCLHISLGRVGNKTKEVMTGVAMSGRVFYNNPIPVEYAKVLV